MKTLKAVHMLPYTAVALYIHLLTTISNCYYFCREIHRKAVSLLSLTTEIILPMFHPILISPFGRSAQT